MSIEFKGLDEFVDQLAEVRSRFPDALETKLRQIANSLKKQVIDRTPTGESDSKKPLKKSYRLSQTQKAGDTLFIEFRSASPHFHLVERGHRQVDKAGREYGFTPGVHMVETSAKELEREMPGDIEDWLKDTTEGLR